MSLSKHRYHSWLSERANIFRANSSTSSYRSNSGSIFQLFRNSMLKKIKPSSGSDSETESVSFYDIFQSFMIAPREMSIAWGDTPIYWKWISMPDSRFSEVAHLRNVCWLDVSVKTETSSFSPNMTYVAYLVFKLTDNNYGLDQTPVETSVGMSDGLKNTKSIILASKKNKNKQRTDGWMEAELGEVYVNGGHNGDDELLEVSVREVKRLNWKGGLIVQGIEFRVKA